MPERPRPKILKKNRARFRGRVLFSAGVLLICGATFYALYKNLIPFNRTPGSPETNYNPEIIGIYCARSCVSVDTEGRAAAHAPRPSGNLVLYIDNEYVEPPHIGESVVSENIIKELHYLRREIQNETGVQLTKASQSRLVAEDFDFQTNKGWRVRLSTTNNAPATVKILSETLAQVAQESKAIEYVDLRIENRVYLKTL